MFGDDKFGPGFCDAGEEFRKFGFRLIGSDCRHGFTHP
jgi:hypothetical protein